MRPLQSHCKGQRRDAARGATMKPSQQTSVYLRRIRRTDRSDVATFTLSAICNSGQSRMPEPTLNLTPTVQDHQAGSRMCGVTGAGSMPSGVVPCGATRRPCPYFPIDGCEITGKTKSLRAARARLRCRHRATTVAMGRGVRLLSAHVEWEAGRRRLVELEFSVS